MSMSDQMASAGVSKHLSALAASYKSSMDNYAAEKVAVPLHQTGLVTGNFQRNIAGWSDLMSDYRAKNQPAAQLDDENESLVNFAIDDHAVRVYVAERDIMLRAQAGVSRERVIENQVRRVTGALMIQREKRLADILTTSGNYNASNSGAVSNYWTSASGTPIDDVLAAVKQVAQGPAKNSDFFMVADESIWITLMANKQIKEAIGALAFAADIETLGKILHVHPVVCKATYGNTNRMFGTNAIIFRRPVEVDPFDEAAECSWRLVHNTESPVTIRQYTTPDMEDAGFWIQGSANYQIIQPYADSSGKINAAYLLTGLTA